jgi:hypothetical protein
MQKLAGFPPIRDDLNNYYRCVYLNEASVDQNEWIDDRSCIYKFENEYFV